MFVATEAELQATGLAEKCLNTYRLAHAHEPPLSNKHVAERLGIVPATVKLHLSRVALALKDPTRFLPSKINRPEMDETVPDTFAAALVKMSDPAATAAQVARDLGISPTAALKIGRKLEGELQPLGRVLEDVRIEDLTKRFGTLTRDAMDAITPEKLEKAHARDLAVIAGIGSQNFQLLRGQPTQRVEISDRRQMDEVVIMLLKEAKRRGVEIDITPEGGVTAGKSKYKNANDRRLVKAITSEDPVEAMAPA